MMWKQGVRVERQDGCRIVLGESWKKVTEEDELIVDLMESGVTDDDALIRAVTEKAERNDILSGFRLAQFVEDYGAFLAEPPDSIVFEA